MSKIYQGQAHVVISIDTGVSLGGASQTKILYKKPNGTKGSWNATVTGTTMSYVPSNTDLDQSGDWQLQAFAVIGGKNALGEVIEMIVNKSLNI
jgi:hypothetical protein